jgi:hypothetical protein
MAENRTVYAGKIYSIADVRCLVYHNDTADASSFQPLQAGLQRQNDIYPASEFDGVRVFTNREVGQHEYASNQGLTVVGGIDVLNVLSQVDSYSPDRDPALFVEQYPFGEAALDSWSRTSRSVVFYGKNLSQLILSSLNSTFYVSPLSLLDPWPTSNWDRDFYYSHLWIPSQLASLEGDKYDFDLNQGFIFARQAGGISLPLTVSSPGSYEIWVRILESPLGGNLSIGLNGQSSTIFTRTESLQGFEWVRFSNLQLLKSNFLQISNNDGFNVLNLIAAVPTQEFENHARFVSNRILADKSLLVIVPRHLMQETVDSSAGLTIYGGASTSNWTTVSGDASYQINSNPSSNATYLTVHGSAHQTSGYFAVSYRFGPLNLGSESLLRLALGSLDTGNTTAFNVRLFDSSGNYLEWAFPPPYPKSSGASWSNFTFSLKRPGTRSVFPFDYHTASRIEFRFWTTPGDTISFSLARISVHPPVLAATVYPPRKGAYSMAVDAVAVDVQASLTVKTSNYSSVMAWASPIGNRSFIQIPDLAAADGPLTLTIGTRGLQIEDVVLFTRDGSSVGSFPSYFGGQGDAKILSAQKDNPANWHLKVKSARDYVFGIKEGYSAFWKASFGVTTLTAFPINGFTVGFVAPGGTSEFNVSFEPEKSFQDGKLLTLIAMPTILLSALFLDGRISFRDSNRLTRLMCRAFHRRRR